VSGGSWGCLRWCLARPLARRRCLVAWRRAGELPGGWQARAPPRPLVTRHATPRCSAGEVCGASDPVAERLAALEGALGRVLAEWGGVLGRELQHLQGGSRWGVAFQDVLLRRLVLRFVLARALLQLHAAFGAEPSYQPACFPELPPCVAPGAAEVQRGVRALVEVLGAAGQFRLGAASGGGAEIEPL
jgi:hypothetical protein